MWKTSLALLLLCHSVIPAHSFFFNQLFGRQTTTSTVPPIEQPAASRGHVISGSDPGNGDVGKSGRIYDGPGGLPPAAPPATAYRGPVRNGEFHVPKSLCIACEKFPWTPVPGSDSVQPLVPPSVAFVAVADRNRRPFAITFDSSQTHNVVSSQQQPAGSSQQQTVEGGKAQQTGPAPTVLQPSRPIPFHPTSRPAQFYNESPAGQYVIPTTYGSPVQYRGPVSHDRPSVLQPVKNNSFYPESIRPTDSPVHFTTAGPGTHDQRQQESRPSFPLTYQFGYRVNQGSLEQQAIGALVASQQQNPSSQGGFQIHAVHSAPLVYHEHITTTGESGKPVETYPGTTGDEAEKSKQNPTAAHSDEQQQQQYPQNIKVPIIPGSSKSPGGHLTINQISLDGSPPQRVPSLRPPVYETGPNNVQRPFLYHPAEPQIGLPSSQMHQYGAPPANNFIFRRPFGPAMSPQQFVSHIQGHPGPKIIISELNGKPMQTPQQSTEQPREVESPPPPSSTSPVEPSSVAPTEEVPHQTPPRQFDRPSVQYRLPNQSDRPNQLGPSVVQPHPQQFPSQKPNLQQYGSQISTQLQYGPPLKQAQQQYNLSPLLQQSSQQQYGPPLSPWPNQHQNGPLTFSQSQQQHGPSIFLHPSQQQYGPPAQRPQQFGPSPSAQYVPQQYSSPSPPQPLPPSRPSYGPALTNAQSQQMYGSPPSQLSYPAQKEQYRAPMPTQELQFVFSSARQPPKPSQFDQENSQQYGPSPPPTPTPSPQPYGPPAARQPQPPEQFRPSFQQYLQQSQSTQQQQGGPSSIVPTVETKYPSPSPFAQIAPHLASILPALIQPAFQRPNQFFPLRNRFPQEGRFPGQFRFPPFPDQQQELAVSQAYEYGAPVEPGYPARRPPHIIPAIPGQTLSIHMEAPPPSRPLKPTGPTLYEAPAVPEVSQEVDQPAPTPEAPSRPATPPTERVTPAERPAQSPEQTTEPALPISIPYLLEIKQAVKSPEDVKNGFASSISSVHIKGPKNVQIVPIPVPKFVEPSRTKTEQEIIKAGNIELFKTPKFSPQIKDPNIVRNSLLQAADQSQDQGESRASGSKQSEEQGGWEIIPATQYDITHLFNNVKIPEDGSAPDPFPVPVPISIPGSPPPQAPIFVVRERFPSEEGPPLIETPETTSQATPASSTDQSVLQQLPTEDQNSSELTSQPVEAQPSDTLTVGMPPMLPADILQPQQSIRYSPLPPSIVTALHHAQRTSFLTHSHLADREPTPKGLVFVDSVPVRQEIDGSRVISAGEIQPVAAPVTVELVRVMSPEQIPFNCSGSPIIPAPVPAEQLPSGRPPYFLYYPTSVQQSSVYWAEQQQQQRGAGSPIGPYSVPVLSNLGPTSQFKQPSGSEQSFSAPVLTWSQRLIPGTNALVPEAPVVPNSYEEEEDKQGPSTRKPFDVITVGQETPVVQPDEVQSLENEEILPMITSPTTATAPTTTMTVPTTTFGTTVRPKPLSSSATKTETYRPIQIFRPAQPVLIPASPIAEATSFQAEYDQTTEESDLMRLPQVTRLKSAKLVGGATPSYTEIFGPTTIADCISETTTEVPPIAFDISTTTETIIAAGTGPPFSATFKSSRFNKNLGGQDKIRLRVGARFPTGRPAISSGVTSGRSFEATGAPSATNVPVYRAQTTDAGDSISTTPGGSRQTTTLLTLEDIYRSSERKQIKDQLEEQEGGRKDSRPVAVSFSKTSSAFSSSAPASGTARPMYDQRGRNESRKLYGSDKVTASGSSLQSISALSGSHPLESAFPTADSSSSFATFSSSSSSSSSSLPEGSSELLKFSGTSSGTTTTTTLSPPTMVTKVVKTVRVRQRMRPGSSTGFSGPVRRFPGRVRVIQRPVSQEYIKSFPEFATPEGESLPKEEEEEVKNALIDLKKIPDRDTFHGRCNDELTTYVWKGPCI